jgi:hypothetical protein
MGEKKLMTFFAMRARYIAVNHVSLPAILQADAADDLKTTLGRGSTIPSGCSDILWLMLGCL